MVQVVHLRRNRQHVQHRVSPRYQHAPTVSVLNSMVGCSDPILHARLRRWSGPAFRGDNMRAAALALTDEMDDLVLRIQRDCGEDPVLETTEGAPRGFVDAIKLFRRLAMDMCVDVLSQSSASKPFAKNHSVLVLQFLGTISIKSTAGSIIHTQRCTFHTLFVARGKRTLTLRPARR